MGVVELIYCLILLCGACEQRPPPQLAGSEKGVLRCEGEVRAVPLHRRPDLVEACADLVNAEWQRSRGARVHALQKSCQDFPVCLLLLQGTGDREQLLGHARLCRVVGHGGSLFVESVVVSKAQRGKGYGRTLMEATERYAQDRGFRRLCLTTHDKQHFYTHLGYVLSRPVQNAGAMTSFVSMEVLQKFSRLPDTEGLPISLNGSDPLSQDSLTPNSLTPPSLEPRPCWRPHTEMPREHPSSGCTRTSESLRSRPHIAATPTQVKGRTLLCMPQARILDQGATALMATSSPILLILTLLGPTGAVAWQQPNRLDAAAAAPPIEGRPFAVVWNMPTAHCRERYGIHLNLSAFDIIENCHECFLGQNMTIFYHTKLGLYPYLSQRDVEVNGGVPQRGHLRAHLAKAKSQIEALLSPRFRGLAVIDWEEWRPLWVENFDAKRKYRELSKELVREEHPELPGEEVTVLAREEFERGAREFMSRTIREHNYTGHCHPKTAERNERLSWLWGQSTALYPSIYLQRHLAGSSDAALMVRFRVLEALRVASRYPSAAIATPVLPYARVAFAHTLHFLNKVDLEHTLGESAALGSAGVVLWGELRFAKSKHQCGLLQEYVSSVLGPYVRALKRGVQRCSQTLCNGNGRCTRRDPHSGRMMHSSSAHDSTHSYAQFHCLCYQGWTGELCQDRMP
ncbi:hypothetical protein AAFF_G00041920 [Aldrovandia affinis]|uniref:Hyaluronidase n=1 Tax=Aldrovandia affinis TaxID=143900 RepID=A0AAD7S314_9TELE|nr:hypothetical protein AAFF_G00041920 [Aldrovandia affinis]